MKRPRFMLYVTLITLLVLAAFGAVVYGGGKSYGYKLAMAEIAEDAEKQVPEQVRVTFHFEEGESITFYEDAKKVVNLQMNIAIFAYKSYLYEEIWTMQDENLVTISSWHFDEGIEAMCIDPSDIDSCWLVVTGRKSATFKQLLEDPN